MFNGVIDILFMFFWRVKCLEYSFFIWKRGRGIGVGSEFVFVKEMSLVWINIGVLFVEWLVLLVYMGFVV